MEHQAGRVEPCRRAGQTARAALVSANIKRSKVEAGRHADIEAGIKLHDAAGDLTCLDVTTLYAAQTLVQLCGCCAAAELDIRVVAGNDTVQS